MDPEEGNTNESAPQEQAATPLEKKGEEASSSPPNSRRKFCFAALALLLLLTLAGCGILWWKLSSSDSTSLDETSSPSASSAEKFLVDKGNNGFPESAFPLGMCEGDCDTDEDCKGVLVCFQRDGLEPVRKFSSDPMLELCVNIVTKFFSFSHNSFL